MYRCVPCNQGPCLKQRGCSRLFLHAMVCVGLLLRWNHGEWVECVAAIWACFRQPIGTAERLEGNCLPNLAGPVAVLVRLCVGSAHVCFVSCTLWGCVHGVQGLAPAGGRLLYVGGGAVAAGPWAIVWNVHHLVQGMCTKHGLASNWGALGNKHPRRGPALRVCF